MQALPLALSMVSTVGGAVASKLMAPKPPSMPKPPQAPTIAGDLNSKGLNPAMPSTMGGTFIGQAGAGPVPTTGSKTQLGQ